MRKNKIKFKSKQQGVALVIGIILLLIIAVIGVTSMKSSLLQEKMAGGLSKKSYTEAAALSLLVTAENYVFNLYKTNNGTEAPLCDYCGEDPRGTEWHNFISKRDMTQGQTYPGTSALNLNAKVRKNLKDDPRFVIYPFSASGASDASEYDGGSAGTSSGNAGDSNSTSKLDYFRIATKANDVTGNLYVIYESVYAVLQK